MIYIIALLFSFIYSQCDEGYVQIQDHCLYNNDLAILQKMIDNSHESGIDLGCEDDSLYCGSPNPQMDSPTDSWFWNVIDGQQYIFADGDGVVEPLELGLQEWNNGRLTSLMCGAYIYCQLSGPIPENINELTEIQQLRLEYNYFSGYIPESICELDTNHDDYLAFDLTGNLLCPPYPECIDTGDFWYQDTSSCSEIGDTNNDGIINILDIIEIVSIVLNGDYYAGGDVNSDMILNVLDIIFLVNLILNDGQEELPDECYLEPDAGPCFGYVPMYYYNQESQTCESFIWGGCAGVVPFESFNECSNACY